MKTGSVAVAFARESARRVGAITLLLGVFASLATQLSPAFAAPVSTPFAVTSVRIDATAVATSVRVSWTPAAQGAPASSYVVYLADEAGFVGKAACSAVCTARTFPGLTPGHSYLASVVPVNDAGAGASQLSPWLSVGSGCAGPKQWCINVDATSAQGSAQQRAQGFIYGTSRFWKGNVDALKPRWWRINVVNGNYQDFDLVTNAGAQIVLNMSDAWLVNAFDSVRGGVPAPWEDFTRYRSWVHTYVAKIVKTGRRPAYWEVMNEPGFEKYLDTAGTMAATPDRVFEQFKIAYEEIKAVDPTANVAGPSLERHTPTAGLYGSLADMTSFVDYLKANSITPGALVWHEISVSWAKNDSTVLPTEIVDHVAEVRALLASRGMSDVKILIDEYSAPSTYARPGWTVGYLAALEAANVDGAMRACWPATSVNGGLYNQCDKGLNGLYAEDNQTPLGNYWVHAAYAAMTGARVAASPSTARISTFATRDDTGVVRMLVGRNESCAPAVLHDCAPGWIPPTPSARAVAVNVTLPANVTAAHVTITRVGPWQRSPKTTVLDSDLAITGGRGSFLLSQVLDCEAYIVTVTPTAFVPTNTSTRYPTASPTPVAPLGIMTAWSFLRR